MQPDLGTSLGRSATPFLIFYPLLTFLQQGELFTLAVRGLGTSAATATNWGANLLINSTYLSLMARITPAGAFGFYAGLCFLGWIFCVLCYPETAGLSLEEVTNVFEDGFGIRKSERMRAEKRKLREGRRMEGQERASEDEKV